MSHTARTALTAAEARSLYLELLARRQELHLQMLVECVCEQWYWCLATTLELQEKSKAKSPNFDARYIVADYGVSELALIREHCGREVPEAKSLEDCRTLAVLFLEIVLREELAEFGLYLQPQLDGHEVGHAISVYLCRREQASAC